MGVLGKCGRRNNDGGVVGGCRGSLHLWTETAALLMVPRPDVPTLKAGGVSDLRTVRLSVGGVDLLQP